MKTTIVLSHPDSAFLYYDIDLPFVSQEGMLLAINDSNSRYKVIKTEYICENKLLRVLTKYIQPSSNPALYIE